MEPPIFEVGNPRGSLQTCGETARIYANPPSRYGALKNTHDVRHHPRRKYGEGPTAPNRRNNAQGFLRLEKPGGEQVKTEVDVNAMRVWRGRRVRATTKAAVVTCACLMFLGIPNAGSAKDGKGKEGERSLSLLHSASVELSELYQTAAKSVVIIESPPMGVSRGGEWDSPDGGGGRKAENDAEPTPPFPEEEVSDTAAGIIFSEEGHVLTNHHVIQNVLSDFVRVKMRDGRILRARILGSDPKTDLAVLQLPTAEPALAKGDSDRVKIGDFVFAIGAPYGLEYSLTMGIVSGRGRNPLTHSAYEDYIQTDAAINPGNSGGPLLNTDGQWIALNTLINGINRGLGFAIPSNQAVQIAEEILKKGTVKRPWIGVRGVIPPQLSETKGVEISWVAEGSPAGKSGLRAKDVILSVNGGEVGSAADLQRKIWHAGIGGKMTMEVRRGKYVKSRTVVPIEMPVGESFQ